jgi:prophage regulatory protein
MNQDEVMSSDRIISIAKVDEMTGLSNVTRWRMEKRGEFPQRRQISPNRIAYLESEVLAWMESRPTSNIKSENDQGGAV